ncbi:MAG: VTT domain-containing protein [Gemmatimonadota bacterium]|nr:VTT domain-containing protein [Gemmatimonadota bacterium]
MTKTRVFGVLLTAVIAIFLVSYTLGRALYAGQSPGITSFALVHFAGYLFFLLMPVEALVPIYQGEGHAALTLVFVAVATALAAQVIDYSIGRAVKEGSLHKVIGEKRYARFKGNIDRWGGWAILLFNLMPLSSPNMLLVAGMTRYSARRAFLFSSIGLTGKYLAIVYAYGPVSSWLSAAS